MSTLCWPIVDSVNFSSNKQLVIVRSSSTYNLSHKNYIIVKKEYVYIYGHCSLLFINIMSVFIFFKLEHIYCRSFRLGSLSVI